jgi:hypothetical protein
VIITSSARERSARSTIWRWTLAASPTSERIGMAAIRARSAGVKGYAFASVRVG